MGFHVFTHRFAAQTTASKVYMYLNAYPLNDPGCSEGFNMGAVCNSSFHSAEIPIIFGGDVGYK